MSRKLLIVAGETSGELYGSLIAKHLKNDFELIGIGGKYMASEGVKLIGEITHSFGALEIIGQIKKIRNNMKKATSVLREVSGLILIDFPDFNLSLAKRAKQLGKKVLYYVSPQIWAWRKERINTIKRVVDFMATVLPFEEKIYKEAQIPAKFVGHPMVEVMEAELGDYKGRDLKRVLKERFKIDKKTVITLMPGSRPSEIKRKMPLMLNLIEKFPKEDTHFLIPKAPNIEFDQDTLRKIYFYENVTILKESSFTALAMSDVALITSGTSTLQATLLQIPMIVVYKVNPVSYLIGKSIIKGVKHIALPNVIADFLNQGDIRVPEFIQKLNQQKIIEEINKMIYDDKYREKIIDFLGEIKKHFDNKKPSEEVVKICKELFY
ncbi:MAG: lipid-A-disaccharide synthase [Thermodesulfovibrio sp.]|nr:lipid-A-disaccharide synthase [Thermodesulfovibrio sp.]